MNTLKQRTIQQLKQRETCQLATRGGDFVDNAAVTYYSEGLTLYFGSFPDTLKCRNIRENPQVALCVDNIQIHGMARSIEYGSAEYIEYRDKYLLKL